MPNVLNDKIDHHLSAITRYSGLKIFSNGLQSIARLTANEYWNLMKVMIFVINNLYDKEIDIFTAFIQLANSIEISKFLIKKGINFNINLNDQ